MEEEDYSGYETEEQAEAETEEQAEEAAQQGEEVKPEDTKEQARKGYEMRKSKEKEAKPEGISREEFDKLNQSVSQLEQEKEMLKFQKDNPWCSDDIYKSLNAEALNTGKSKEEVLKDNPVWKHYVSTEVSKHRVDKATVPPSSGGSPNPSLDYSTMSNEDFQARLKEIRSRA